MTCGQALVPGPRVWRPCCAVFLYLFKQRVGRVEVDLQMCHLSVGAVRGAESNHMK